MVLDVSITIGAWPGIWMVPYGPATSRGGGGGKTNIAAVMAFDFEAIKESRLDSCWGYN